MNIINKLSTLNRENMLTDAVNNPPGPNPWAYGLGGIEKIKRPARRVPPP